VGRLGPTFILGARNDRRSHDRGSGKHHSGPCQEMSIEHVWSPPRFKR
jgi:hypothetical protein